MKGHKFKDMFVQPGTKLFDALESKDLKLAEKLYKEMDAEFRKWFPNGLPEVDRTRMFPIGYLLLSNSDGESND